MSQPKGPAIHVPTAFNGDTSKTKKFLKECDIYFNGKPEEFKDGTGKIDEQKRIWFVLSYMKEGLADTWRDDYIEQTSKDASKAYTSWAAMRTALEQEFKDVNSGKNARDSMARLRQGNNDVAVYTAAFKDLMAMAGINDDIALTDLYLNGLNDNIHDALILNSDGLKTLKDYQDRAMVIYGRLKQKRTRGSGLYIPPARRDYVATPGTRANPIVVNRERLSPEKQAELRKKGACFRCEKVGHLARDCPSRRPNQGPSNNTNRGGRPPFRARQANIQERLGEILKDATSDDIGEILMTVRENLGEGFQETE
jgi:hypothetical protein